MGCRAESKFRLSVPPLFSHAVVGLKLFGEKTNNMRFQMVYNYLDSVAHQELSRIDEVKRNPIGSMLYFAPLQENISTEVNTQTLLRDLIANDEAYPTKRLTTTSML